MRYCHREVCVSLALPQALVKMFRSLSGHDRTKARSAPSATDAPDSVLKAHSHYIPTDHAGPASGWSGARVSGWLMPGAMVRSMMLLVFLAIVLVGIVTAVLVAQVTSNEALQRLVAQQTDEVEVISRLLSSKIEQSQKVLRAAAAELTPTAVDNLAVNDWVIPQGLPAVRFFDAIYLMAANGQSQTSVRGGRLDRTEPVPEQEYAVMQSTVTGGKPLVVAQTPQIPGEARVVFTVPINRADGHLWGVLAGTLRLQSQGLLPASLVLPANDGSRLMVVSHDGLLLAHSDASRALGYVKDEPVLAEVYRQWQQAGSQYQERGVASRMGESVVSLSGMPLPRWLVARVSDTTTLIAPLRTAQRQAAWQVGTLVALAALLVIMIMARLAQPLAKLSYRATRGTWVDSGLDQLQPTMPWTQGDEPAARPEPRAPLPRHHEAAVLARALDRQAAHIALQQTYQAQLADHLAGILDNATVGIVITRRGIVEVVSHYAGQMLGYLPQELQGQSARLVYASDEDFTRLQEQARAGFAAHGSFNGDVAFLRKDGATVWARVQGRALQAEHAHKPGNSYTGTVWILEDLTAAREWLAPPGWDTLYDSMTRLPNRDGFAQRLQMLLAERARRVRSLPPRVPGSPAMAESDLGCDGVVLFIDLDHFSVVNDVAGHDAGDDVLRHVARLLESTVRSIGWVARLGGDEFTVVLPGCPLTRAHAVAEQLRKALHEWQPSYQGRSFTLGASVGLVVLNATVHDVTGVLRAADMACYTAKRAGRNRVEVIQSGEVVSGFATLNP